MLRSLFVIVGVAVLFSISYTQSPLYTSNQNQYFLHGFARAGVGELETDWLANTVDPTPVFSMLVELTIKVFHAPGIFYLYYAVLLGIYIWCLIGIVSTIWDMRSPIARYMLLLAALILVHSAGMRFFLTHWVSAGSTYLFEGGVANQLLLGTVLQPSTFGILLLLSIYLFLLGHRIWAVASASLAATIHPTYLLSSATLILAFVLLTILEDRPVRERLRSGFWIVITAIALTTPILLYTVINFQPQNSPIAQEAQQILVYFRIPHHALVSNWFNRKEIFKIVIILTGMILVRKSRFLFILLIPFGVGLALTLLQLLTGSITLALIFPWRVSTFLLPLSMTIIIAWIIQHITSVPFFEHSLAQKILLGFSIAIISFCVVIGIVRMVLDFERKDSSAETTLLSFVVEHRAAGQNYLTPIKLQDFRLSTGVPVFIDFKSIPYQDGSIVEWYFRNQLADEFYRTFNCSLLDDIQQTDPITDIVLPSDTPELVCESTSLIYNDPNYRVYSFNSQQP